MGVKTKNKRKYIPYFEDHIRIQVLCNYKLNAFDLLLGRDLLIKFFILLQSFLHASTTHLSAACPLKCKICMSLNCFGIFFLFNYKKHRLGNVGFAVGH